MQVMWKGIQSTLLHDNPHEDPSKGKALSVLIVWGVVCDVIPSGASHEKPQQHQTAQMHFVRAGLYSARSSEGPYAIPAYRRTYVTIPPSCRTQFNLSAFFLSGPFSCEVCGHTFSRRKLLRQHMQLHGEKRFKCKYCDLAFSQSAGRRGHEIRVHNAT